MSRCIFALLSVLFWLPAAHAQLEDELLDPDSAFAISAEAVDAGIQVTWDVAEGYYLYQDRIRFSTSTPGLSLGEPVFPAGKVKDDEFFGRVTIHRGRMVVLVPVERRSEVLDLGITAVSQGCADVGVCYPPHTQNLRVTLASASLDAPAPIPALADKPAPLAALGALGQSLGLGAATEDELLPADEAFQFDAELRGNTLLARWVIAEGYYLYRDKIRLSLRDADGVRLGPPALPTGEVKDDEFFGRIEIYHGVLEVPVPVLRDGPASGPVTLEAGYQGCAEAGVCYPPVKKILSLTLPTASDAAMADAPTPSATASAPAGAAGVAAMVSEQDRIAQGLMGGSTLLTVLSFFGFGLLLAFTPCVFPMIPILSSVLVGQGDKLTARRGFILSLVYVLAMALTYTAAGVFAGLFGENLQAAFQNPWILGGFAAVFVALALSMFGFYDLQMPSALQSKLTELSNRQQGGTLVGVAVMGFLSALIVGPCVAAPLAGALIYIGQTGDAVLGGVALFALSMGMGAPLVAIGTGAGKLLPRAGDWMNTIKAVFGVLLLAVAIWMLERVLPLAITLALWAALLIISSVFLGALDSLGRDATGWRRFWKGTGLLMLVYGALLLIGVAGGASDMLQPLRGLGYSQTSGGPATATHLPFRNVKSVADVQREVAAAASRGQPVMLDFYADWCVTCKEMEKYTFTDNGVRQALEGMLLLQADVTANDDQDTALLKHFGLIGPPSMLFFDRQGNEQRPLRLVGFLPAEKFRAHVDKLGR